MEVILSLQAKAVWHVLEALVRLLRSLVTRELPYLETGAKEICPSTWLLVGILRTTPELRQFSSLVVFPDSVFQ
jgi:hypothetical protein